MASSRGKLQKETSAGGVVFRRGASGVRYLLIRDSYQNWGFPKGHLEGDESFEEAALREVREETGIETLEARGPIEAIDWHFSFRGRRVHKVCHFYLMEATSSRTRPQRNEGITACRWLPIGKALEVISYGNAREILERAHEQVVALTAGQLPSQKPPHSPD